MRMGGSAQHSWFAGFYGDPDATSAALAASQAAMEEGHADSVSPAPKATFNVEHPHEEAGKRFPPCPHTLCNVMPIQADVCTFQTHAKPDWMLSTPRTRNGIACRHLPILGVMCCTLFVLPPEPVNPQDNAGNCLMPGPDSMPTPVASPNCCGENNVECFSLRTCTWVSHKCMSI